MIKVSRATGRLHAKFMEIFAFCDVHMPDELASLERLKGSVSDDKLERIDPLTRRHEILSEIHEALFGVPTRDCEIADDGRTPFVTLKSDISDGAPGVWRVRRRRFGRASGLGCGLLGNHPARSCAHSPRTRRSVRELRRRERNASFASRAGELQAMSRSAVLRLRRCVECLQPFAVKRRDGFFCRWQCQLDHRERCASRFPRSRPPIVQDARSVAPTTDESPALEAAEAILLTMSWKANERDDEDAKSRSARVAVKRLPGKRPCRLRDASLTGYKAKRCQNRTAYRVICETEHARYAFDTCAAHLTRAVDLLLVRETPEYVAWFGQHSSVGARSACEHRLDRRPRYDDVGTMSGQPYVREPPLVKRRAGTSSVRIAHESKRGSVR